MMFFEVGRFELRKKCDELIKNDIFSAGDFFDKHKIDRGLISDEQGEVFLFERITFSFLVVDTGQVDDVPHPEDGISHLVTVADSFPLGIQTEFLEKSEQIFACSRKRRFQGLVFCSLESFHKMREILFYRYGGVLQLPKTSVIISRRKKGREKKRKQI